MTFGDIVYKLHNEHGLSNTCTTEETDLTAFAVRFEKVDDLYTGSEDLSSDGEVFEFGCGLVDRAQVVAVQFGQLVDSLSDNVKKATLDLLSGGNGYGTIEVFHLETAAKAVGTFHCHTADGILTDMLLHFENQLGAVGTVDFESRVNRRNDVVVAFEDDVDHRANHLGNLAYFVAHLIIWSLLVLDLGLEMPSEDDDENHQHEIDEIDGKEIFPFERQQLVDTETGKCPLEPDDDERENESFAKEPNDRRDIVHDMVESFPTGDMERHPAAEE